MYAEFGSKQGLFEAVLARYDERHLTASIAALEAERASLPGIRRAFGGYVRASGGWARGRGCLLANTAVERAAADPASARFVQAYFDRLTAAFRAALSNAVDAGELVASAPLDALASFLTMSLVGVAVMARAQADPSQIGAARDVVVQALDAHRTG
jgi:TetR/AcrR family transcriptional repressor of nem operon